MQIYFVYFTFSNDFCNRLSGFGKSSYSLLALSQLQSNIANFMIFLFVQLYSFDIFIVLIDDNIVLINNRNLYNIKVVFDLKCGTITSIEPPKKSEFGGILHIYHRRANLKFNQDDIGMMRHKSVGKMTDKIFRLARSEGSVPFILFS